MDYSTKLITLFSIFCVVIISGCAIIGNLGGDAKLANYALASNGASISASDYTRGHSPLTAINGITSSEKWDEGEGWECRFERKQPKTDGWSRLDPRNMLDYGSAWLEVQFNAEMLINRSTIYTLDSSQYPAYQYGIKDAWFQIWKEYGWTTVGEIENGALVSQISKDREPVGGKIVFRFEPTKTDKVRFVVFRSNDFETRSTGSNGRKIDKSVARVVEIQVTGLESVSSKAGDKDENQLEIAPDFSLPNLDDEWVRLSTFQRQVVIVTFWAQWSSESTRQVRELNSLYQEYKDKGLIVLGISVDEGGAERIKTFVQNSGLRYPVLIANTSTKTKYGGIGKLPTTFVINQEGRIYKSYDSFQGRHILELDIKKLISE